VEEEKVKEKELFMKKGIMILVMAFLSGCGPWKAYYLDKYQTYRMEMERLNLDREKSNLPTRPILSYKEWRKQ
jgi:hypothetical protein